MTSLADLIEAKPATLDRDILDRSGILVFDIETIPARVEFDTYDLKLRNPYVPHAKVTRPGEMLCWAAQWYHEPHAVRYRDRRHPDMLADLWALLDEAAYVVTFNGDRFDLRKVRGYFARAGFPPFRPPKSIDLMKTAGTFGFESKSLDYSCRMFGVRRKRLDTGGAARWEACLAGDDIAWKEMRSYCTGDVRATTDLYDAMRPWLKAAPSVGFAANDSENRCPRCGSADVTDVGAHQAVVIRYRMWRCGNCTGLSTSTMHSRVATSRAV